MVNTISTIWQRSMKRYFRSPSRIIGGITMPLLFLIILGFGLEKVIQIPGIQGNYINYLIPGVISITVISTAIFSGIEVISDKKHGFLKETLIAPVSRISVVLGQTLGEATVAVSQGTVMLIISFALVPQIFSIQGFLVSICFMFLIGISFTALGVALASVIENEQGFQLITNLAVFPILFLSGAFIPFSNEPAVLKLATYANPLTYGVDGIRYALSGTSKIRPEVSFGFLAIFTLIMIIIGGYLFNRMKVS